MMSVQKKGWCPTLTRPMETGDGLLVRIHKNNAMLTAQEARAIAACALRYGNGHIDLTSRGNVQLRGVTEESYPLLIEELTRLGIGEEPRPPRVLEKKLLPLGEVNGGLSLGLPFGRMEAAQLLWLADRANGTILLTTGRVVILPGVMGLLGEAAAQGFITQSNDPLWAIQACPGAPSCHQALGDTRMLARKIAEVSAGRTVHVSGCAKGCACSDKTDILVVAEAGGYAMGSAHGLSAEDILQKVQG